MYKTINYTKTLIVRLSRNQFRHLCKALLVVLYLIQNKCIHHLKICVLWYSLATHFETRRLSVFLVYRSIALCSLLSYKRFACTMTMFPRSQPVYMFIMFGRNDVLVYYTEQYSVLARPGSRSTHD